MKRFKQYTEATNDQEYSDAAKAGMAAFAAKQQRRKEKYHEKRGLDKYGRVKQNTFGHGSYGPKQFAEKDVTEAGRGSIVSKVKTDDGRRVTSSQRTGDTKTSGGGGTTTTNRQGLKIQHSTPRIHGLKVTKKYDPNEKNLDPDQTSDDPTSTSTNYRGKYKGTKIDVTQKGGPGEFNINKPSSVKLKHGNVRVAQTGNKRSVDFTMGKNKISHTVKGHKATTARVREDIDEKLSPFRGEDPGRQARRERMRRAGIEMNPGRTPDLDDVGSKPDKPAVKKSDVRVVDTVKGPSGKTYQIKTGGASPDKPDLDDFGPSSKRVKPVKPSTSQVANKRKYGTAAPPAPEKKEPTPSDPLGPPVPEPVAKKEPPTQEPQSFGQAFSAARKKAGGPGGQFSWKGKTFNTRQADDPKSSKSELVRRRKSIRSTASGIQPRPADLPTSSQIANKKKTGSAAPKHDVSTKAGRQSWYKDRVAKARKAGHPNPTMYASQAALETGWGKSKSAKGNLVGMKARRDQASERKRTKEVVGGKEVKTSADFAQFDKEEGGIAQHGKEWKGGLTKSGGRRYATDPDYEKKIAAITRGYGAPAGPLKASFDPTARSVRKSFKQYQIDELMDAPTPVPKPIPKAKPVQQDIPSMVKRTRKALQSKEVQNIGGTIDKFAATLDKGIAGMADKDHQRYRHDKSRKVAKAAHDYTTGPIAKRNRENPNQYAKMFAKAQGKKWKGGRTAPKPKDSAAPRDVAVGQEDLGDAYNPAVGEGIAALMPPTAAHWVNRKVHGKEHDHATKALLKSWKTDRSKKEFGGDRLALAHKVSQDYQNVTPRSLVQHVNSKVKKGDLPDHLRLGRNREDED